MFITLVNRVATSHASFVIKPPAARDGDIVCSLLARSVRHLRLILVRL